MNRFLLSPAFLLFAVCVSGAAQTPRAVVERYLSLETHGALLDSRDPNMRLIQKLMIDEDEAGYDTSTVVKAYRILSVVEGPSKAQVEVVYEDLGTVADGTPQRQTKLEKVVYSLRKTRSGWKVDGLRQPPHVLKAVMVEFMKPDDARARNDLDRVAAIKEISGW